MLTNTSAAQGIDSVRMELEAENTPGHGTPPARLLRGGDGRRRAEAATDRPCGVTTRVRYAHTGTHTASEMQRHISNKSPEVSPLNG